MNTLPEDIQNTIYKYKHQLEFRNVLEEFQWLWFEEETKIKEYCETRGRIIRNGLDAGMSYSEAVDNFEFGQRLRSTFKLISFDSA